MIHLGYLIRLAWSLSGIEVGVRNGKILKGEDSECNFKDDHDLMNNAKRNNPARQHPQRVAFGLPHNYGKYTDQHVSPDDGYDRRASPLFIHIHECEGKPVAVLSFIPARFLPENKSGNNKTGKKGRKQPYINVGGFKVAQKPEKRVV